MKVKKTEKPKLIRSEKKILRLINEKALKFQHFIYTRRQDNKSVCLYQNDTLKLYIKDNKQAKLYTDAQYKQYYRDSPCFI